MYQLIHKALGKLVHLYRVLESIHWYDPHKRQFSNA